VPIFLEAIRVGRKVEAARQPNSDYGIRCIAALKPVFYVGGVHESALG